ncbi:putative Cytochrome P450 [Seiridium unicorne]|uniref:Cytochrome P450 n=1 Tax=Seiridium unicorne TaxID=138068 RepID=A0ABR2UM72_9PEZI
MDYLCAPLLIHLLETLIFASVIYACVKIIYNVYFHPLAKFPGPFLAAITNVPYSYWFLSGRQPYKLLEIHVRYGPVVRTAPNELSFNTPESWRDIYGHRSDHKTFVKGKFYAGGSYAGIGTTSVVSERSPHTHRQMRSYLSGAFSEKSLAEQEQLVSQSVDKFICSLGVKGLSPGGCDLSALLEMLTFDVTGELAFGESFGCLDKDVHHPWISVTFGALMQGALVDVLNRFPLLAKFILVAFRRKISKMTADTRMNENWALQAVQRRIRSKNPRQDFLARILDQRDPSIISDEQIAAHASDLVVAGSDTSATALSACIYYLLRVPSAKLKLQTEIREEFGQYDDINGASTSALEYLNAVIREALRMYPPLPLGLPRVVPLGGATVNGEFLPEGITVSTNPLAACLSPQNFSEPLEFKPERWIGTNSEDSCAASQPFSLGPRACIGRNLAWMEMRTTLAKLIWMYDFELIDKTLDWHKDSEMHTLWRRPSLYIRTKQRCTPKDTSG